MAQAFVFTVAFEFDVAAFGGQRYDAGNAHFHGFLNGVVHAVAFRQGLPEYDLQVGLCDIGGRRSYLDRHVFLAGLGDGGGVVVAVAVEQQQFLAGLHAQHTADVLRCIVVQAGCGAFTQG